MEEKGLLKMPAPFPAQRDDPRCSLRPLLGYGARPVPHARAGPSCSGRALQTQSAQTDLGIFPPRPLLLLEAFSPRETLSTTQASGPEVWGGRGQSAYKQTGQGYHPGGHTESVTHGDKLGCEWGGGGGLK